MRYVVYLPVFNKAKPINFVIERDFIIVVHVDDIWEQYAEK
jgi:hypothetical protein